MFLAACGAQVLFDFFAAYYRGQVDCGWLLMAAFA
jgi:hypothetical protein